MDYSAPFRDLIGTKVVLVQGELREDVVVEEIVLQLGDPDEEELRLRVATAEAAEQVVYLIPRDATRATSVYPLNRFLPETPIAVVWSEAPPRPPVTPRRRRPSALAGG
jgi:hypothetical protein